MSMVAEIPEDGLDGTAFELVIRFGGTSVPCGKIALVGRGGERESFRRTAVHAISLAHAASLEYAKTGCVPSTLKICDIRFHAPLDAHYMEGLGERADAIDGAFLPLRSVCASPPSRQRRSEGGDGRFAVRQSRYLEITISDKYARSRKESCVAKLVADAKGYLTSLEEVFAAAGASSSSGSRTTTTTTSSVKSSSSRSRSNNSAAALSAAFLRYVLLLTRSCLGAPAAAAAALGKPATARDRSGRKFFYLADELLKADEPPRLDRPAWKRATALLVKSILDKLDVPCKVFSYDRVAMKSSGRWLEAGMEALPPTLEPVGTKP